MCFTTLATDSFFGCAFLDGLFNLLCESLDRDLDDFSLNCRCPIFIFISLESHAVVHRRTRIELSFDHDFLRRRRRALGTFRMLGVLRLSAVEITIDTSHRFIGISDGDFSRIRINRALFILDLLDRVQTPRH